MRYHIRSFVEKLPKNFNMIEPIVEIGSFIVKGQEDRANLRSIFSGKQYIGCDLRSGPGVDQIENVEHLSFENDSIGTILILDTLEHVQNCFNALNEIYRVLDEDGMIIMSSVMDYVIHDYPSDYWRFTPAAFKLLLDKFPINIIGYQGRVNFPHTIIGIGIKSNNFEKYKINFENLKKLCIDITWI